MAQHTDLDRQAVAEPDPLDALSERERAFVEAYVGEAKWCGADAARLAGYDRQSSEALWVTASRMLSKAKVKAAIRAMVANTAMQAEELLTILGSQARLDPALMAQCYKTEVAPDGVRTTAIRVVDWDRVRELGLGPLIRSVKQTKYGETVEFVDCQRAAEMIGRALGLFADRLRVEGQIDYSKLTDDELKQLAAGKRPSTL